MMTTTQPFSGAKDEDDLTLKQTYQLKNIELHKEEKNKENRIFKKIFDYHETKNYNDEDTSSFSVCNDTT